MKKEEYVMLDKIKRLINKMQEEIRRKEKEIEITKAEINQLCDFIVRIEELGELEKRRIEKLEKGLEVVNND